jgi:hypothetical protein
VQWTYGPANYIAAAEHACWRTGTSASRLVETTVADRLGTEHLGRVGKLRSVTGYELVGGRAIRVPVAMPTPTGRGWIAHGMLASWRDMIVMLRELLHGGCFSDIAAELRRPYAADGIRLIFQGPGARLVRAGTATWAAHGGQWPGHRIWIAFGKQTGVIAYSRCRDRSPDLRNITRSILAELAAHEDVAQDTAAGGRSDGENQALGRWHLTETLTLRGPAALSPAARAQLGSSIQVSFTSSNTGVLRTRREYPIQLFSAVPGAWRYRTEDEDRLLLATREKGVLLVVLERPGCILEAVR